MRIGFYKYQIVGIIAIMDINIVTVAQEHLHLLH